MLRMNLSGMHDILHQTKGMKCVCIASNPSNNRFVSIMKRHKTVCVAEFASEDTYALVVHTIGSKRKQVTVVGAATSEDRWYILTTLGVIVRVFSYCKHRSIPVIMMKSDYYLRIV